MRLGMLGLCAAAAALMSNSCSPPAAEQSIPISEAARTEMERINAYVPAPVDSPLAVDARYAAVEGATYASSILASTVPPPYDPAFVRAQILLDRAHFSPGVIDGQPGDNVSKAVKAYQTAHGLAVTGQADAALLQALDGADSAPAIVAYTITAADAKGPFVIVPKELEAMAKLKRLSFGSPAEALAEKFHMDEDFLRALNPGVDFTKAGAQILVANAGGDLTAQVAAIEVDKGANQLRAYDAQNNLIATYPATIGSTDKPAPIGAFTVESVAFDPTYHFNAERLPTFNKPNQGPLTIAAGPNSPVGAVWIDLSLDTYGIHGAPDAELVGKTSSHGCVRLTNWDVQELGRALKAGVPVRFIEAGATATANDEKRG